MTKSKIKISFIVPCFNEESNIINTIEEILHISNKCIFDRFELIIIDDGSTDNTFKQVKANKNIRKFKHKKNIGIGAAYKTGLQKSKGEYIIMIPGDNSHPLSSIKPIIEKIGTSDIIIPFTTKKGGRSIARFFLSKAFTFLINTLFNLNLKYFNGTVLHKKSLLNLIKIQSNGFDYQAEILIKLIRKGFSYEEVEVLINERKEGTSKAVSLSNGFKIMWNLISLKKKFNSS